MSKSKSLNAYSPDGRIYQIEYAMTAMTLGTTCIGYEGKDFTLLVSEKKILNKLQVPSSIVKHIKIFDNILMGFSGISSDTRVITEKARDFCLDHYLNFNEPPTVAALAQYLCDLALNFGEKEWDKKILGRPFGVTLLLAGDCLMTVDPSGSYRRYKAKSIGMDVDIKIGDYSLEEAIKHLLMALRGCMREKMTSENIEIGYVNKDGVHRMTMEEIQTILNEIIFEEVN
ncbi:putative proteasome subunit alpha type-5 [Dictyocoela muelleri]|nr:putative proteasome subunit alpha type-5 [Dictyocoela muelleri]